MIKKYSSEIFKSVIDLETESNKSDFEILSLRVPHANSALIQSFCIASPRNRVLTLLTDEISKHLSDRLLESRDNASLILEELRNPIQHGSALDILQSNGAIEYDTSKIKAQIEELMRPVTKK